MKSLFAMAAALGVVTVGAAVGGFATTGSAQAQVLTVRQVVSRCPDSRAAAACPTLAAAFLTNRPPGAQTDAQIVNLVLALADATQQPRVSLPMCLNAADGIRVLAGGMVNSGQAGQVRDVADALCDDTRTAATGAGSAGVPVSLVDGGGSDGGGGVASRNSGGAGGGPAPTDSSNPPPGGGNAPSGGNGDPAPGDDGSGPGNTDDDDDSGDGDGHGGHGSHEGHDGDDDHDDDGGDDDDDRDDDDHDDDDDDDEDDD